MLRPGLQLELWREHAAKSLPVLMRATDMLICGEDLGFLAPCVHPLMKELGLVGEYLRALWQNFVWLGCLACGPKRPLGNPQPFRLWRCGFGKAAK